jgi:hypothetical protein
VCPRDNNQLKCHLKLKQFIGLTSSALEVTTREARRRIALVYFIVDNVVVGGCESVELNRVI